MGFLGDSAAGKTPIVNSIMGLEFKKDLLATIGSQKIERKFKLKIQRNKNNYLGRFW